MRPFLEWLGNTPWSVALLESYWVWPLVESTHVLSLGLFVGTAVINDLRLLGWTMKRIPASDVTGGVLPWTRIGFGVMMATGLLLVYSSPLRYYHNIFFRFKVLLLIVAGLNAFVFHRRIHRSVSTWDLDSPPPREARRAGAVSLITWALIVVSGRLIAYNWFECDIQPQSDFINWASACVVELE